MPTADRVLLDTHALLWWKAGAERLSATAARLIDTASEVLISPINCWEVAVLVGKDRVQLDRPVRTWVTDVLASDGVELAPLTASIAVAAAELSEFHGDPADRFLVATATTNRVPLVTKDRLIHAHADSTDGFEVIW